MFVVMMMAGMTAFFATGTLLEGEVELKSVVARHDVAGEQAAIEGDDGMPLIEMFDMHRNALKTVTAGAKREVF